MGEATGAESNLLYFSTGMGMERGPGSADETMH
jgi:hypothetical protein